jgi:hypothetical protein
MRDLLLMRRVEVEERRAEIGQAKNPGELQDWGRMGIRFATEWHAMMADKSPYLAHLAAVLSQDCVEFVAECAARVGSELWTDVAKVRNLRS